MTIQSYTNVMAGKEFAFSISEYLYVSQKKEIQRSHFYNLMVAESRDRGAEKHMVIYASFLSNGGLGDCKIEFIILILVVDGFAQTKFDVILKVVEELGLNIQNMVGIATDGDSSMLLVPHLISTHCIAHTESLALLDACKNFPCFSYIDKIANRVYSWTHGSSVRHRNFQKLLEEMNLQALEVLQIHDVRWLSRGKVMERLVVLMPTILTFWKIDATCWYEKLRIFKVLFLIHFIAHVLHELNELNCHFQEENVDMCSAKINQVFHWILVQVMSIVVKQQQKNLLFSAIFYSKESKKSKTSRVRESKVKEWLEKLIDRVGDSLIVPKSCREEIFSFVDTLYYACEGMSMKDSWKVLSSNINWHSTYSIILKLWQIVLVLAVSSVACERGFSKQNLIKTSMRQSLKVKTLDMLMRISLNGPNLSEMDWVEIHKIWELQKCRKFVDV
ncbi:hypothetical protein KP509_20G056100 [Ceratopteris richardii]|uniref:HAT C-terminal dimerisation domain-containing protein n=1 Tax=Ceratopteris richardii TaxID=49495 RepID=A0A8T2SIN5_CERRI|nr:hypothetical protein KP509_20G056100 [Ceratopteris richardii]